MSASVSESTVLSSCDGSDKGLGDGSDKAVGDGSGKGLDFGFTLLFPGLLSFASPIRKISLKISSTSDSIDFVYSEAADAAEIVVSFSATSLGLG